MCFLSKIPFHICHILRKRDADNALGTLRMFPHSTLISDVIQHSSVNCFKTYVNVSRPSYDFNVSNYVGFISKDIPKFHLLNVNP